MKTVPANASGPARESPRCTAPTSTPIEIANAAGRVPLSRRDVHQAAARPRSAFGRTLKNFHSLRSVSDWSTTAFYFFGGLIMMCAPAVPGDISHGALSLGLVESPVDSGVANGT